MANIEYTWQLVESNKNTYYNKSGTSDSATAYYFYEEGGRAGRMHFSLDKIKTEVKNKLGIEDLSKVKIKSAFLFLRTFTAVSGAKMNLNYNTSNNYDDRKNDSSTVVSHIENIILPETNNTNINIDITKMTQDLFNVKKDLNDVYLWYYTATALSKQGSFYGPNNSSYKPKIFLNLGKKGALLYHNGEWVTASPQIYTNGEWKEIDIKIF